MSGEPKRWRITMFREPQPPPFDHPYEVAAPDGEKWVARSLAAALRLVDARLFLAAHPELVEEKQP